MRDREHTRPVNAGSPALALVPTQIERPLRIAMLAPPWIPIPPPGYGGVELVVGDLCEGLVARGHDVTLFAAPGTTSSATVRTVLDTTHEDEIERSLYEADHVARVFGMIDAAAAAGTPFDVVHDHCGFTGLAMADRLHLPFVHTLHGPFTQQTSAFYSAHGHKATLVAISEAQAATAPSDLVVGAVVPNPIDCDGWPTRLVKDDYLLWIGRMHPTKGAHRAIDVAKAAGARIVLAGVVQRGQEDFFMREVRPHIDGDRVQWLGEVGGQAKRELFAGARALLMPIRWPEPFGMVMVEALASGTPVLAFPEGAAAHIVRDGITGFLVADEAEMVAAVDKLDQLDSAACRADVEARFSVSSVAAAYDAVYRRAIVGSQVRTVPGDDKVVRPTAATSAAVLAP